MSSRSPIFPILEMDPQIKDIEKLAALKLDRVSELLGDVNISTTQIQAGYQHNIIPNQCSFVVDVRSNGLYKKLDPMIFLYTFV